MKDTGILLLPSETFQHGSEHIRVGFGKENFADGLNRLEDYLNKNDITALVK